MEKLNSENLINKVDLKLGVDDYSTNPSFGHKRYSSISKAPGLKAEVNGANGGIGVSFSHMALGSEAMYPVIPRSSYQ
jgi:hypothetical protein